MSFTLLSWPYYNLPNTKVLYSCGSSQLWYFVKVKGYYTLAATILFPILSIWPNHRRTLLSILSSITFITPQGFLICAFVTLPILIITQQTPEVFPSTTLIQEFSFSIHYHTIEQSCLNTYSQPSHTKDANS